MSGKADCVRAEVVIRGLVQGVCFRAYTEEKALSLGLSGHVRNMADGGVEAAFEGLRDDVEEAVQWCRHGPSSARVASVDVVWTAPRGEEGFHIRF